MSKDQVDDMLRRHKTDLDAKQAEIDDILDTKDKAERSKRKTQEEVISSVLGALPLSCSG